MSAKAVLCGHMTEAEFQAEIVAEATANGWLSYHTHDSRHSASGFPDLILVRGPEMLALEVKRETTESTPAQEMWLWALGAVERVTTSLVRPSHWDALAQRLRARGGLEAVTS